MEASSWPAFTSSPVCTFISMISPEAFDFTSTVSTGSMAPDADADTTTVRRETGTASYVGAAWGLPQAMTPASAVTAARAYVFMADLPLIARDLAVEQMNLAARVRRNVVFVRHQHDGLARVVELVKQPHDLVARRRVEVARRLVGEQNARSIHQRARDGDALALATRQLVGPVVHAVGQLHLLERAGGALAPLLGRHPGIDQRQLDVVQRIGPGQQIERLEHEPDLLVRGSRSGS